MPSRDLELIAVLLQGFCPSPSEAQAALTAARELGLDPLDYCMHQHDLGAEEVMRRAADWLELAFSPVVPATARTRAEKVGRIDALATTRIIREALDEREVVYLAPQFDHVLQLRGYLDTHPGLRRTTCIVPPAAIRTALAKFSATQLLDEARQRLARRWPFASAHLDLGRVARWILVVAVAALVAMATVAPGLGADLVMPLLAVLLVVPGLFKLAAVVSASPAPPPAPPLTDAALPCYSVLVPLRDEAQMVPQLRRALVALSYPPEKLDLKFVVEARSVATIAAVRGLLHDPRFELVIVPDAPPLTKPKALNYALPFVRGDHVVVFDAEDIPDPDQLRLAAAGFAAAPGVDCLQAELLVDNARENALTGLFAGEYAGQFGVMMPALARWGLPMPLGGTSNHFRTRALREVGGWDAFNVTEDADLGVRLARLRYRAGMLDSRTWEEAPISLSVWRRQRTRWMKGWMQTFIVHNRDPVRLWRDLGWRGFLAFEIHVGSLIVSPLLHTAFLAGVLFRFATGGPGPSLADPATIAQLAILVAGYAGSFALVVAGLQRLGQRRLVWLQALLPLYWVLHSVATVEAARDLLIRPHHWGKTTHGLTRFERSFPPDAPERLAAEQPKGVNETLEQLKDASQPS